MICKACGKQFTGAACPHCGIRPDSEGHSDELVRLLKNATDGGGKYREGYEKGLKEGYQNGYVAASRDCTAGASATAPETPVTPVPAGRSFSLKHLLIAAGVCFAVGGLLFGGSGTDVSMPYVVMGVVVLLVAFVFSRSQLPEIQAEEDAGAGEAAAEEANGGPSGWANIRQLFHNRAFVFGLSALLAYEVSEISINSYFVNFTTGMGWLTAANASYILGLSLFIFMGGRFVGSWIMRRIAAERVLLWCACGTVLSIGLLFLNSQLGVVGYQFSLALLIANYFFEAIMFPTIFSLTLQGLGGLTKSASSLLMMTPVGGCGFLLMALLADRSGSLTLPFLIPLAGYIVVLIFARRKANDRLTD
jgi:FHS family L-fucose permease-like MFS transporter